MTRLSKEFTFKIRDGTAPDRAYFIAQKFEERLFKFLEDENGKENLTEFIEMYPELEVLKY